MKQDNKLKIPYNELLFDKSYRKRLRNNPNKEMIGLDYKNVDIEYKVITNKKDTVYIVLADKTLSKKLDTVLAGVHTPTSTIGSAGTVGSASTYACVGTLFGTAGTMSTFGSAGTVGSIGTVGSK